MNEGFMEKKEESKIENFGRLTTKEEATNKAIFIKEDILYLENIISLNEEEILEEDILKINILFKNTKGKDNIKYVSQKISYLKYELYQSETAGINGEEKVNVAYPTGSFYKESKFGVEMIEKKEEIKKLYHYIGTTLDNIFMNILPEYNKNVKKDDQVFLEKNMEHIFEWYSALVVDNENEKKIECNFEKGKIAFDVTKINNNWNVSISKEASLDAFLWSTEFSDKLTKEIHNIQNLFTEKANELLG